MHNCNLALTRARRTAARADLLKIIRNRSVRYVRGYTKYMQCCKIRTPHCGDTRAQVRILIIYWKMCFIDFRDVMKLRSAKSLDLGYK